LVVVQALVQMVEQLSLLPNDPPAVQASASLSKKKSQPAQLVQQPDNILFDLMCASISNVTAKVTSFVL